MYITVSCLSLFSSIAYTIHFRDGTSTSSQYVATLYIKHVQVQVHGFAKCTLLLPNTKNFSYKEEIDVNTKTGRR